MAHYSPEELRAVESLLEGLSPRQVWELCIQALRRWRKKSGQSCFQMHGHLGLAIVPALAAAKGVTVDANRLKEVFLYGQPEPALQDVVEFSWWMVRAGMAIPYNWERDSSGYPCMLRLTRAGMAFLDAEEELHPLLPGWPDRVRQRCPGISDEVVALLEDARACMDASLLRPAVVLMGVAYETAIDAVIEDLKRTNRLASSIDKEHRAAQRLAKVAGVITTVLTDSEDARAAIDAYAFADRLRCRRNDAAHTRPRYGFEDRQEVEELIVSAARHLPGLWSLVQP